MPPNKFCMLSSYTAETPSFISVAIFAPFSQGAGCKKANVFTSYKTFCVKNDSPFSC